jgi:hypothetical protein
LSLSIIASRVLKVALHHDLKISNARQPKLRPVCKFDCKVCLSPVCLDREGASNMSLACICRSRSRSRSARRSQERGHEIIPTRACLQIYSPGHRIRPELRDAHALELLRIKARPTLSLGKPEKCCTKTLFSRATLAAESGCGDESVLGAAQRPSSARQNKKLRDVARNRGHGLHEDSTSAVKAKLKVHVSGEWHHSSGMTHDGVVYISGTR